MSKKHDWNSLQNYLEVHYKVLRIYSSHLSIKKDYVYTKVTENFHTLEAIGLIFRSYKGTQIRFDIRKDVEVDTKHTSGKPWARTYGYSYNANIPGGKNLIRYDSPHDDADSTPIDHHKFHHKHDYTKDPPEIVRIPEDQWPHVNEFLLEVLSRF